MILDTCCGCQRAEAHHSPVTTVRVLVIPRYAVTACETVTIYWFVFVVMSKEEGLCTVERPSYPNSTRPNEY